MKEKKVLNAKEIEAQTVLELPDRQLMGKCCSGATANAAQAFNLIILALGGLI
jgi:hypothetical protein